ncbi:MAG: hypothetical protein AAF491_09965 [Verrucomicrobiota bacterium]
MKRVVHFLGNCLKAQWKSFRAEPLSHFIFWGILIGLMDSLPPRGSEIAGDDTFLACIYAILASAMLAAIFHRRNSENRPPAWQERIGSLAFGLAFVVLYLRAGFPGYFGEAQLGFSFGVIAVGYVTWSVFDAWGKRIQGRVAQGG